MGNHATSSQVHAESGRGRLTHYDLKLENL